MLHHKLPDSVEIIRLDLAQVGQGRIDSQFEDLSALPKNLKLIHYQMTKNQSDSEKERQQAPNGTISSEDDSRTCTIFEARIIIFSIIFLHFRQQSNIFVKLDLRISYLFKFCLKEVILLILIGSKILFNHIQQLT